jgi:very-short-patch-repair endonuclease
MLRQYTHHGARRNQHLGLRAKSLRALALARQFHWGALIVGFAHNCLQLIINIDNFPWT